MADSFVKLWQSILESSIWSAPDRHRLVWIAMLVMADQNGFVGASIDGLARRANVPVEDAEKAIESFLAPDPLSRSDIAEGRRIEKVGRGWHILNHGYFRDLRDKEARRDYERERKRKQRAGKCPAVTGTCPDASGTDAGQDGTSSGLSRMSAQAYAYAEAQADAPSPKESTSRKRSAPDLPPDFLEFWEAYGKKGSRRESLARWIKMKPTPEMAAEVIAAAKAYRAAHTDDPKFQRDAQRWLKHEGWNDELPPSSVSAAAFKPTIVPRQSRPGDYAGPAVQDL